MEKRQLRKGLYISYESKDSLYEVLGSAIDVITKERLVVYKSEYEDIERNITIGQMFVSPITLFLEKVPDGEENPTGQMYRFEYVEDSRDMSNEREEY